MKRPEAADYESLMKAYVKGCLAKHVVLSCIQQTTYADVTKDSSQDIRHNVKLYFTRQTIENRGSGLSIFFIDPRDTNKSWNVIVDGCKTVKEAYRALWHKIKGLTVCVLDEDGKSQYVHQIPETLDELKMELALNGVKQADV